MSRLIGYGPGEISDRLSILSLKILHAPSDRDVSHFRVELAALAAQLLERRTFSDSTSLGMAAKKLDQVNARLWRLEDEMRTFRLVVVGQSDDWSNAREIAICALEINALNAQRSELIAEINRLAGHTGGPEKIR